jgi:hypothetical protein
MEQWNDGAIKIISTQNLNSPEKIEAGFDYDVFQMILLLLLIETQDSSSQYSNVPLFQHSKGD